MSNGSNPLNIGAQGENFVANWLREKKFVIKAKNYRKRYGEIDLIAQKDDLIIFVEVKSRKINYFDLGQVIVPSKQRKIILTAKEYISTNHFVDKIFRFDVALVKQKNDGNFDITYIPNAFTE